MLDHSTILLTLDIYSNKRGEGYWKINNKILEDDNFVNKIRQAILDTVQYYEGTSKKMLWELLKVKNSNRS